VSLKSAQFRAHIYKQIRIFFESRKVLEVETPLLSSSSCIDEYVDPVIITGFKEPASAVYYLQTSPELYMKQLLCDGYPSLFQICKSFRKDEQGRLHHPEFTLLEWYRLNFTLDDLIQEVADLVQNLVSKFPVEIRDYRDLFLDATGFDPTKTTAAECISFLEKKNTPPGLEDKKDCITYIMSEYVEPRLPKNTLNFIKNYPADQAALAELNPSDPATALRFELFINGVELCNGYQELREAQEYSRRFNQTNKHRQLRGLEPLSLNEPFLKKIQQGLPPCSGVALGLDRLIMLGMDTPNIQDVLDFTLDD